MICGRGMSSDAGRRPGVKGMTGHPPAVFSHQCWKWKKRTAGKKPRSFPSQRPFPFHRFLYPSVTLFYLIFHSFHVCPWKHSKIAVNSNLTQGKEGWWSGVVVSMLASINEVKLCRTRLVLRWATVSGSIPGAGHLASVTFMATSSCN